MPLVEYDVTRGRARNESGKVGGPLKKLNTTDVAPITRDTSYFASVTRRNDSCSLSCANTAKSVTDSSRSCACFMKTFLAENFFGVCKRGRRRGEGETRERERDDRAGGIKAGLILIFKFCGETTVRYRGTEKVQAREGNEDETEKDRGKERMASHNRFSNS